MKYTSNTALGTLASMAEGCTRLPRCSASSEGLLTNILDLFDDLDFTTRRIFYYMGLVMDE